MSKNLIGVSLAAVLAACSGGGGDGGSGDDGGSVVAGSACEYITGGGTTTLLTPGCPSCTSEGEASSIDGNSDTHATIVFPALASGDMALRATAQSGVVYPAGSHPGAIVSGSSSGGFVQSDLEIRLYFEGALVGVNSVASINGVGGGAQNPTPYYVSYTAPVQFDAVEIGFYRATGDGESVLNIHEFCSD